MKKENDTESQELRRETTPTNKLEFMKDHRKEIVISTPRAGFSSHSSLKELCANKKFIFEIEPNIVDDALSEKSWIMFIHDEFNQFTGNNILRLVSKPNNHPIVGTK